MADPATQIAIFPVDHVSAGGYYVTFTKATKALFNNMISIDAKKDLLSINIFGELTLEDYQALEKAIIHSLEKTPRVSLFVDLSLMSGFTVDVAWEDIKFVGAHSHDFKRIAILSADQWLSWAGWINAAFTDAETKIFENSNEALAWIKEI